MLDIEELREAFCYQDGRLFWKIHTKGHGGPIVPGDRAGYLMPIGYRGIGLRGHKLYEHRVIFAIVNGRWPANHLDHKDGNRSNNLLSNLRECTPSLNLQNSGPRADNKTSGVRGVSYRKRSNRYIAELRLDGKRVFHKSCKTVEEAIAHRLAAERQFHPFSPRI